MRCFHVWLLVRLPCFSCVCPLFRCLLLFQSLPPPPFFRSNSFRCSIASSILSLCASSVQLYPSFLSRYLLLFYSLCPFLLSLLCVRLLTHALYFPCVPFVPVPLPLCRPFYLSFLRPWAFRSPCACFQSRCLHLPGAIPPFPRHPFSPLSPSFPRFPSPILLFFPFLLLPFRKKFPLKSCMILSVKYMFYSIFLACLWKFS